MLDMFSPQPNDHNLMGMVILSTENFLDEEMANEVAEMYMSNGRTVFILKESDKNKFLDKSDFNI